MSDELTALLHQQMPVAVTLGMTADQAGPDHVAIRLPWSEQLCTDGGRIHGGVIMTLADSAGGVCAFFNLPDGAAFTTTIESKSNFFRAVTEGDVCRDCSTTSHWVNHHRRRDRGPQRRPPCGQGHADANRQPRN